MLDAHAELAALRARRAAVQHKTYRVSRQARYRAELVLALICNSMLRPWTQKLWTPNIDKLARVRYMSDLLGTSFFTKI